MMTSFRHCHNSTGGQLFTSEYIKDYSVTSRRVVSRDYGRYRDYDEVFIMGTLDTIIIKYYIVSP